MNTTQLYPLVDGEYITTAAIVNVPKQELWKPTRPQRKILETVVSIVLSGIVCGFGVMGNICNIVVFYRQGPMSSSPTLILTGLAVSDLFASLYGLFWVFCKSMEWYVGRIVFGWWIQNLMVLYCYGPSIVMIQATCWIMFLLTLERAVSVTLPFKVKALFTPRRSLAVVVAIFTLTTVLHIPSLTQYKIVWHTNDWYPGPYKRILRSFIFPQSVHDASYIVNDIILQFLSVFLVVVCNVIIAGKVKSSQKFRKSKALSTTDGALGHTQEDTQAGENKETKPEGNNPSSKDIKDRKLIRMISVVSGVFVFCFSFGIINTIVMQLIFTPRVDYHVVVGNQIGAVLQLFKFFNSSINAVIYFNMSARYKEEVLLLFGKGKKTP